MSDPVRTSSGTAAVTRTCTKAAVALGLQARPVSVTGLMICGSHGYGLRLCHNRPLWDAPETVLMVTLTMAGRC